MYASYKDNEDVAFYFVYLAEIHPAEQGRSGPEIEQHETFEERVTAASDCLDGLEMTIPTLIDTMEAEAQKLYQVHAAGTVVIDVDGDLAFHSSGPNGCKPDEADRVIRDLLGLDEPETEEASE